MASDMPYLAQHQTVDGMAVALVWLFGTLCSHGVETAMQYIVFTVGLSQSAWCKVSAALLPSWVASYESMPACAYVVVWW
jgi:hypothetical protein